jgi:hypothetical protein
MLLSIGGMKDEGSIGLRYTIRTGVFVTAILTVASTIAVPLRRKAFARITEELPRPALGRLYVCRRVT